MVLPSYLSPRSADFTDNESRNVVNNLVVEAVGVNEGASKKFFRSSKIMFHSAKLALLSPQASSLVFPASPIIFSIVLQFQNQRVALRDDKTCQVTRARSSAFNSLLLRTTFPSSTISLLCHSGKYTPRRWQE